MADKHSLRRAISCPGPLTTVWQNSTSDQDAGLTLKSIAAGNNGVVVGRRDGRLHRFEQDQLVQTWQISASEIRCLSMSSDERYVLAGTEEGNVSLLTLPSGETIRRFPGHDDRVTGVAFLGPDAIVSSSRDGSIRLFRTDGTPIISLEMPGPVLRFDISPDGTRLAAVVEGERAARVWHLDHLSKELSHFALPLKMEHLQAASSPTITRPLIPQPRNIANQSIGPNGLKMEVFAGSLHRRLMERFDRGVNLVSTDQTPDLTRPPDPYSVRWSGWLKPDEPGPYELALYHDDGVRLWLDGELLLGWYPELTGLHTTNVFLSNRAYSIRVAYRNSYSKSAICRLLWRKPNQELWELIPSECLFRDRDTATNAVLAPRGSGDAVSVAAPPTGPNGLKAELIMGMRTPAPGSTVRELRREWYDDHGPKLGSPVPGISEDFFSIAWTGWIHAPKAGRYTFVTESDNGVFFAIDGNVLKHDVAVARPFKADVELTSDFHSLEIRIEKQLGNACCKLLWIPPGCSTPEVIPKEFLFHGQEAFSNRVNSWVGFGNHVNRNNFGLSSDSRTGDSPGRVGGTFATGSIPLGENCTPGAYFADIDLGGTLDLSMPFQARGSFVVTESSAFNGGVDIHFFRRADTEAMPCKDKDMRANTMGLSISDPDPITVGHRALIRFHLADGSYESTQSLNRPFGIVVGMPYRFRLSYSPKGGVHGHGRLSAKLFSGEILLDTGSLDLNPTHRAIGASFDAFGLRFGNETAITPSPNLVTLFLDELVYTRLPQIDSIRADESIAH